MLDEQMVGENTEVLENVPNFDRSKEYLQKNVQPVDQVEPVDDQSDISDESGHSAPHFHSFPKFKEQIDLKEVMCDEDSDGTENDDKAVGITIDQDIEQNVADNLLEPPSVIPAAVQPPSTLPSFTLPTMWTRVIVMTSVPVVDSDLFIVKTQGVSRRSLSGWQG
jgi:hypothetical protein